MAENTRNPNFKVFVRIRQSDSVPKHLEYTDKVIKLTETPQNSEKDKPVTHEFSFDTVFDANYTQEMIFKTVENHCVSQIREGNNACVISYGQTTGGKTFTIFGEDEHYTPGMNYTIDRFDRRGLVPRTLECLLRRSKELESMRSFVISCSMYEIYLDQIRDLGKLQGDSPQMKRNSLQGGNKPFLSVSALQSNFETENLEITENSNGQIMIKNLTHVTIKSINDVYELMLAGFSIRTKFETKSNQLSARAHTIFTVNLIQKDRQNESLPFVNSTMHFVDLAGSERTVKSMSDGHKFQESLIINSNLTGIGKSNTKNVPYKENKLTRVLQNCISSLSYVVFFGNINPSENCVEETLSTLQFSDRTKNLDLKGKNILMVEESLAMSMGNLGGSDKIVKKLNEEINEVKGKIDGMHKEYKQKLMTLQNILGIEHDLDKLITKPNDKDLRIFRIQREAITELENVNSQIREIEDEMSEIHEEIEIIKNEDFLKQTKYEKKIDNLKNNNKALKDKLQESKKGFEEEIHTLSKERIMDLMKIVESSKGSLEEKAYSLLNRQQIMQNYQGEFFKELETQKLKKIENSREFKANLDEIKEEYNKKLNLLRQTVLLSQI